MNIPSGLNPRGYCMRRQPDGSYGFCQGEGGLFFNLFSLLSPMLKIKMGIFGANRNFRQGPFYFTIGLSFSLTVWLSGHHQDRQGNR